MHTLSRSASTVALCAIATAMLALVFTRATARADEAADKAPTDIAVCDFVRLVDEVYESDRFRKPREEFEDSLWPADLKAKRKEMEALQERMENLDGDSPEYADAYERWDAISDEVWAKQSEIEEQVSTRELRDRDKAFALVVSTAADIAEENGHKFVAMGGRAKPLADDADSDALYEAIRFRVFLAVPVFPAHADITDDVRFELGLR